MEEKKHRAGFVNIIGNPNVGKSTLMNAFMGERLSSITPKAQTTRHRIMGILNDADYQLVFSDTPGVIKPAYALQESMMSFVKEALDDADILLYMVEIGEKSLKDERLYHSIEQLGIPVFVLINKIDRASQAEVEEAVQYWSEKLPSAEIWLLSALEKFNVDELRARLVSLLPESPPYYEKDSLTTQSERFIVEEAIREKILLHYKKEIPYSVQVEVESFKEEADIIRIGAIVYTERDTQKSILIGKKGESIKRVGTEARIDMEKFFKKRIFLEIFVKVNANWRQDENKLKRFGYR